MIDRGDPTRLPMGYLQAAALGPELVRTPRAFLMIGLGGGGFVPYLLVRYPALRIDAVEIDPVVVEIARDFFGISEDRHIGIHVADGADFLAEAAASETNYDVIFLDAYTGADIPAHLSTVEFFRRVRDRLSDGGVALVNLGLENQEAEAVVLYEFAHAFPHACLQVRPHTGDNRVLMGARSELPEADQLVSIAHKADARGSRDFSFEIIARTRQPCRMGP